MAEPKLKFLGSSKISTNYRISLVLEASEKLDVEEGDHVLFYEDEKGQIVIKKG